jgi:hypothetical protein
MLLRADVQECIQMQTHDILQAVVLVGLVATFIAVTWRTAR